MLIFLSSSLLSAAEPKTKKVANNFLRESESNLDAEQGDEIGKKCSSAHAMSHKAHASLRPPNFPLTTFAAEKLRQQQRNSLATNEKI